jgi:hypothetical protein
MPAGRIKNQSRKNGSQGERLSRKEDDGQEEVEAQVGSHAPRIDVNEEEMMAMLDACLEKTEANPEELPFVAVHQEVLEAEAAVEMI